ncbi:hypothetical protein D3C71_1978360 [compost metagenome]
MTHAGVIANDTAKVSQGPTAKFLNNFVGAIIPATGDNDLGYMLARQPAYHIVDHWIRLRAGSIQGQYRLLRGFVVLDEVALTNAVGVADFSNKAPAIDQGFRDCF